MRVIRFEKEYEGEITKVVYLSIWRIRITSVLAETNWKSEEVVRKIPVWIDKNSLYIYRLAFRVNVVN